ncbi:MAG: ComF family protein [Solirubrobacterales bacterium]
MRYRDVLLQATSLLAPPRCGACGEPCPPSDCLCRSCWVEIGPAGRSSLPGLDGVAWAAPYDGAARRALAALKFGARTRLAIPVGALTATTCAEAAAGRTVVAVPPAKRRLRARGFDPAALIAAEVAHRLGLPRAACLRRLDARRQVGRSRAERLASPPRVQARGPVPPRVLLVDDVLTTGATLTACARALADAGCASVAAATFARSLGETSRPA